MGVEDTRFECEVCTHTMSSKEMSPTQDVCNVCHDRADRDEDYS